MSEETDSLVAAQAETPSRRKTRFGVALILLSGIFFFSMLSVPWLPLSGFQKTLVAGTLFIAVQIAWWVGAALAGPSVVGVFRNYFRSSKPGDPEK